MLPSTAGGTGSTPVQGTKILHAMHLGKEKKNINLQRANSLEKTLMLGKTEGKRRGGWQRMRWLDGITNTMDMNLSTNSGR